MYVEWVQKILSPSVKDDERFVLFYDNLTAQVSDKFIECVSQLSGVGWYGLPNATDLWQPVDAGYAQILKTLICQAQKFMPSSRLRLEKRSCSDRPLT